MYLGISYLGVDNHTALLEEEKRCAVALEELLQQSYEQSLYDPLADSEAFRKCTGAVTMVAKSIRWRIQFLGDLNERMQRNAEAVHALLDELEEAFE